MTLPMPAARQLRIPLRRLTVDQPGLNPGLLADLLDGRRRDTQPLQVRRSGSFYVIQTGGGRHQYAYALIVGLPDLPCVLDDEGEAA